MYKNDKGEELLTAEEHEKRKEGTPFYYVDRPYTTDSGKILHMMEVIWGEREEK